MVAATVVGDDHKLVGHGVVADFARPAITRSKPLVIVQHPVPNGSFRRQAGVPANFGQRATVHQLAENPLGDLRGVHPGAAAAHDEISCESLQIADLAIICGMTIVLIQEGTRMAWRRRKNPPRIAAGGFRAKHLTLMKTP